MLGRDSPALRDSIGGGVHEIADALLRGLNVRGLNQRERVPVLEGRSERCLRITVIEEAHRGGVDSEKFQGYLLLEHEGSKKHQGWSDVIEPILVFRAVGLRDAVVTEDAPPEALPAKALEHASNVRAQIIVGGGDVVGDGHRHVVTLSDVRCGRLRTNG